MEIVTSKQWALDMLDLAKGALHAGIAAALTALLAFINAAVKAGTPLVLPTETDLQAIAGVAFIAGFSYLTRNFAKPSQVIITPDKPNIDNACKA